MIAIETSDDIEANRRDDRAAAEDRVHALGDLLARGWATDADIEAIRSMAGPFLRDHASVKPYAAFVALRAA